MGKMTDKEIEDTLAIIERRAPCGGPLTTFDGNAATIGIITSRGEFDTVLYWLAACERHFRQALEELKARRADEAAS